MVHKLKAYSSLFIGLLISPLAFSAPVQNSYFDHICNSFQPKHNETIVYKNSHSEYLANIQMIETYKQFITCQSKDSNVHLDSKFDLKLKELDLEFKKTSRLSDEKLFELNSKITRIFDTTKSTYVEFLRRLGLNIQTAQDKKNIEDLIERVSTVRLVKSKSCNMHNAAYDPLSHTINICKEILNYPEATLVSVISHELTHSIDPCMLQFSFSLISGGNPFFKSDAVLDESDMKSAYTTIPFEWAENDFDVSADNFKTLIQGITTDKNPFLKTIQCLESAESLQAKRRQKELKDSIITDTERVCSSSLLDGEIQESFADWMAYEVLAEYLKKISANERYRAAFEGVLNITANECKTLKGDIEIEMRKAILSSPACSASATTFFIQQDQLRNQTLLNSHPSGQRRVDRLYLAQPYIQQIIFGRMTSKMNSSIKSPMNPLTNKAAALHCQPLSGKDL